MSLIDADERLIYRSHGIEAFTIPFASQWCKVNGRYLQHTRRLFSMFTTHACAAVKHNKNNCKNVPPFMQ